MRSDGHIWSPPSALRPRVPGMPCGTTEHVLPGMRGVPAVPCALAQVVRNIPHRQLYPWLYLLIARCHTEWVQRYIEFSERTEHFTHEDPDSGEFVSFILTRRSFKRDILQVKFLKVVI